MWRTVKLGELCDISIGKTPARGDKRFWDKEKLSDNVWLSIADLTSASGRYISDSKEYVSDEGANLFKPVPSDTLVMSFKLSIGKLAFTERELRTNEAIAALPIKDDAVVTKEFLYHYLSSLDWNEIAGNDVKVKGKTLNKKKLNALQVTFPPLAEQQRIVAKLDTAFAEIDRAINISKSRQHEAAKVFLNAVNHYISLERNPNWDKRIVYDVCESIIDCINKTAPTVDEITEYKMLRTTNIRHGKVDTENVRYVSKETYEQWTRRQVPHRGDVILTREAPMGEVGMILTEEKVFLGQRMVSYRTNPSVIDNEFLLFALQSNFVQKQISEKASGATVQHMRVPHTKELVVPLPSIPQQKEIVRKLKALGRKLLELEAPLNLVTENYETLKSAILTQELEPPQSEAA